MNTHHSLPSDNGSSERLTIRLSDWVSDGESERLTIRLSDWMSDGEPERLLERAADERLVGALKLIASIQRLAGEVAPVEEVFEHG